jgi:hypothetical protein
MRTLALLLLASIPVFSQVWPVQKANDWYKQQPWLTGANYLPANAINQLEMWQPETWDPKTIDREFALAESIGMNTMRVFLHDILWKQDAPGFKKRLDEFLAIAARHKIRPMLVFFDSCWDPFPKPGKQRNPTPGVHNSGWVQSPGANLLNDDSAIPMLQKYVTDMVSTFRDDKRILAWDIWNEPDNGNDSSYGKVELKNKKERVAKLLPLMFQAARDGKPSQPLTSGVWVGDDWTPASKELTPIQKLQLAESDVISFHDYRTPDKFEARVKQLQAYGRPLICTEFLARNAGSTFEGVLPIAKRHKVGMINWGLVAGKSQTNLPWDSWQKPYVGREPKIWQHEVFKTDGTPYIASEIPFLRQITGRGK